MCKRLHIPKMYELLSTDMSRTLENNYCVKYMKAFIVWPPISCGIFCKVFFLLHEILTVGHQNVRSAETAREIMSCSL